jgi:hypothetical protein
VTATATPRYTQAIGGVSVTLTPASELGDDVRASLIGAADDIRTGHLVDNMANGPTRVYGDPRKLLPYWDLLIVDVDLPNFARAAELTASPTEALRRLAGGHHPAGWPVTDSTKAAAAAVVAALTNASAVLIIVNHLSPHP